MGYLDFNFDLPADETFMPEPARVRAWARLLPKEPFTFAPKVDDRAAWGRWRETSFGRRVLKRARELAAVPFPPFNNEEYLDSMDRQDVTLVNRDIPLIRQRQVAFLLAEAIHDEGEFISAIEGDVRELAKLNTWIHPGNDLKRKNYAGETIENDLCSCHHAVHFMYFNHVLGERLSAEVKDLILSEVEWRFFAPLRERLESGRDLYWWLTVVHNWNAVCLCCYAQAAAMLPRAEDRAWWLAAVEPLVRPFRDGFEDDGLCSEGTSYWNYGMTHYVSLSEVLRMATGGVVDLLDEPKARRMARYPDHAEIQPGVYPCFSDCRADAQPHGWLRIWLENRVENAATDAVPAPANFDPFADMALQFADEACLWMFRTTDPLAPRRRPFTPALRDWFADLGFLICRPAPGVRHGLAATLLGGNNGVNHNHNDMGTFTVLLDGRTMLTDPGAEIYSARTFSAQRYDSPLLNSYGHPVPRVGGQLQQPGPERRARVLETDFTDARDRVVLDLRPGYDEPALRRLERTFIFDRDEGSVTIIDTVAFSEPTEFETALITFAEVTLNRDGATLVLDGVAVEVELMASETSLELSTDRIDQEPHPTRIAIRCAEAVTEASITQRIIPVKLRKKA